MGRPTAAWLSNNSMASHIGRHSQTKNMNLSKKLAYTLRHGATTQKIPMRHDGYVRVADLLSNAAYHGVTEEDIHDVVATNDKKRFSLQKKNGVLWICANQGHTLKVDVVLQDVTDAQQVPVAVHGTSLSKYQGIMAHGLSRMARNHVHLAPGLPTDQGVISGMRKSSQVYIFVDVARAIADGMKFSLSANNVILTEGFDGVIPVKYFDRVVLADDPHTNLLDRKEASKPPHSEVCGVWCEGQTKQ